MTRLYWYLHGYVQFVFTGGFAEDFINEYGVKAAPVTDQKDMEALKKRGYKPVIVSEAKKKVILDSAYFEDVKEENKKIKESQKPLSERFYIFAEKIETKLNEDETIELYGFLDELSDEEKKKNEGANLL